jgi:fumarate reductase subunit C
MDGWWRKNPYYIEYMVHEATAVFVAAYAVLLLAGLLCLAGGEAAWNAWLGLLRSPVCEGLSLLILAAFLYHAWTWFCIMPRTLPPIVLGSRRLSAQEITVGGLAVALTTNLLLLAVLEWVAR